MKQIVSFYILENNGQILLASRKQNTRKNSWIHIFHNFFGGKDEKKEKSLGEILCFDLMEIKKSGLKIENSEKRGVLRFFYPEEVKEIHVYTGNALGEPVETENFAPEWFPASEVPYESMNEHDEYWLPFLLSGKNFKASFYFDEKRNMKRQSLERVGSF